jgi:hypothetical protein
MAFYIFLAVRSKISVQQFCNFQAHDTQKIVNNMNRLQLSFLFIFAFTILGTAGCNSSQAAENKTPSPVTITPDRLVPSFTSAKSPDCYFNWSTQPLPQLSAQVQAAVNTAGLAGTSAIAEAYGENCYDADNKPVYFTALETDFRFQVQVKTLTDKSLLGDLLERILVIVNDFPPSVTHTPQTGYIAITFEAGANAMRLWFKIEDANAARSRGLHQADLLEELQHK